MQQSNQPNKPPRKFLIKKAVGDRYGGRCTRTIDRWIKNESLGFPQPIEINGRDYFDVEALAQWDRERAIASVRGIEKKKSEPTFSPIPTSCKASTTTPVDNTPLPEEITPPGFNNSPKYNPNGGVS